MKEISAFLPPETVEILSSIGPVFPDRLAFETEMTVVFSDMRGFTELSEMYEPRKVYTAINDSLAIQTRLVMKYQGSVNKFLGDGLLACFSGDDRAERAVNCVVDMLQQLRARETEQICLPSPVGFGINDGRVLFGLLGTSERREFTVIGDVVNTAARLCGIAQPFQALVTEPAVSKLAGSTGEAYCHFHSRHQFKGKSSPMDVYYIKA